MTFDEVDCFAVRRHAVAVQRHVTQSLFLSGFHTAYYCPVTGPKRNLVVGLLLSFSKTVVNRILSCTRILHNVQKQIVSYQNPQVQPSKLLYV